MNETKFNFDKNIPPELLPRIKALVLPLVPLIPKWCEVVEIRSKLLEAPKLDKQPVEFDAPQLCAVTGEILSSGYRIKDATTMESVGV